MEDQDSSVNNETQKPLLTFISLGSKGRLVVSAARSKPKTERSVSTIDQSPVRFSLYHGHGRCYRAEELKHGQQTLAPLKVKSQPQRQRQSLLADRRHEPGSGGLPEGAAHTKQSSHHWRQRFNVRQSICSASLIRRARPGFSP
jgi:hypothetical protein